MVLSIIVLIIIVLISMIFFVKIYKDCITTYEKIILSILGLIFLFPTIIFYLDLYNVPSVLGYNRSINTQNWLAFISSYLSGTISAIIGAIILVYMTMYQINKNNEDNDKRDKDNNRIQNMPLLTYKIRTSDECEMTGLYCLIKTKFSEDISSKYKLNILVKNIGLNSVKRICIKLESEILNKPTCLIGEKTQISIEKNDSIKIYSDLLLEKDRKYMIGLNVYYEDVLNNWYLQKIEVNYSTKEKNRSVASYIVKEEILIDKTNIL